MRSIVPLLYFSFSQLAVVLAQQGNATSNATIPAPSVTLSPTITPPPYTWEPTTTFPPTRTPTRAPIPDPVPNRTCYSNLTEIDDKNKLKSPFVEETFVLCPNTVFEIGQWGEDGDVVDGYNFLHPRSYTIYSCGEDGKSTNNCTFRGGTYQIYHTFVSYNRENKVGVVVKGITFDSSVEAGIILAAPGDITFIDCHFINHASTGVVQMIYSYSNTRRLSQIHAIPNEAERLHHERKYYSEILKDPVAMKEHMEEARTGYERSLQVSGDILEKQVATFENCVFAGNAVGPEGVLTQDGIIFVASSSNEVILKNCIFKNNSYGSPVNGANGYAVFAVEGVAISIADTCFIDNDFVGDGLILTDSMELFEHSNVYGTFDEGLSCPFAFIEDTCIPYSSETCLVNAVPSGDAGDSPVAAPVVVPTAPVVAPTSGTASVTLGFSFIGIFMVIFF